MAPALTTVAASAEPSPLDAAQILRASTALLRKIQADEEVKKSTASKTDLLADADEQDADDEVPVWLILSTKKHVLDKKRLKPTKIVLPHPILDIQNETLRVCIISADPQRKYKNLIAEPSFPADLAARIQRVIGLEKLKAKYKSYESRRKLFAEYDVFLADDRVITYLPKVLGKVFYKNGDKRPVPIKLEGKRQANDEQGNKRRKLAEGGTKVLKDEITPATAAREIERALSSALVHLAPSTTTAVKVGLAKMEPEQLQANIDVVVRELVEKSIPRKWNNMRSIHIKGPSTAALPIWMTEELWEDEQDVLEEAPVMKESKKRKRGALTEDANVIEVPGQDGKMRRLEKPFKVDDAAVKAPSSKKKPKQIEDGAEDVQAVEKAAKKARKEALAEQKKAAKETAEAAVVAPEAKKAKKSKKTASAA